MHVKKGFTLIEVMIAITIVGLMMVAIVPFLRQQPGTERKEFVAQLNALVHFAWQQSIITRAVHRILFDFKKRHAEVERVTVHSDQTPSFQKITGSDTSLSWPESILIKQFFIDGFDEMQRFTARSVETIWFYIIPDGMTQRVTINGVDKNVEIGGKLWHFGLVLNPFLAQFKEYDTFQK